MRNKRERKRGETRRHSDKEMPRDTHESKTEREQSWYKPDPPHRGKVSCSLAASPPFLSLSHPLSLWKRQED